MIIAALLAALGTAPAASRPDDVDRFISICVDGGKQLLDRSGKSVEGKDVPQIYVQLVGRPGDRGASTLRYFRVGQPEELVFSQEYSRASAPVRWACTLVTSGFDGASAKDALMERLRNRGIEEVTLERFIPINLSYDHQLAYSNIVVQDKLEKREAIDRFTLQTSDPSFEVFVRPLVPSNLYALSVLSLSEKDAQNAQRAWKKCQKINCSLPR